MATLTQKTEQLGQVCLAVARQDLSIDWLAGCNIPSLERFLTHATLLTLQDGAILSPEEIEGIKALHWVLYRIQTEKKALLGAKNEE